MLWSNPGQRRLVASAYGGDQEVAVTAALQERTAASSVDEERLREAVAYIEANLPRWNQNVYAGRGPSGSVHCLAAWVCHLAKLDVFAMLDQPGGGRLIYRTARELLRFTDDQAHRIFHFTETAHRRHPTIVQFKARITRVTGVTFE